MGANGRADAHAFACLFTPEMFGLAAMEGPMFCTSLLAMRVPNPGTRSGIAVPYAISAHRSTGGKKFRRKKESVFPRMARIVASIFTKSGKCFPLGLEGWFLIVDNGWEIPLR
jgi:hypothetical protein